MNKGLKFARLLSTTILVAMWASSASAGTYYVSQSGNDTTGKDLPSAFRTIQKCAVVARAGDTCLIRGGTYRETVTPASSGGSGAPITFDSYNGERVIISGANVIPSSSFTVYSGTTYKAPIANLGAGMNQIFMSGAVQSEARFPDQASQGLGYTVPLLNAVWPAMGKFVVTSTSQITSTLLTGQAAGMWNGGFYSGIHYYGFQMQNANINSSTSGSLAITPTSSKWYAPPATVPEAGLGFISGVMNALNLPGEWVVQGGTLYIKLPTGQTPASTVIEAKARQLAFNLTGKSFISIKKLEVIGAGVMLYGGSNNIIDGTKLSFIHQNSRPANDGSPNAAGIYLAGSNHTIRNANISYSSGGCVNLLGLNHTVTNSIIHDCGYAGYGAVISMQVNPNTESGTSPRGGHTITRNTLYNGSNMVINMGRHVPYFSQTGRQHIPYYKTGLPTPYLKSMITNNEIYNCNILTRDLGGHFYAHGTDGGGTEIANNVIHDQLERVNGFSVYFDEGTYNFNVHNNIVWLGREGGGLRKGFYAAGNGTSGAATQVINTPSFTSINYNSVAPYPQGKARIFKDNTYKFNYHGGVAGLTAADFPGGVKFAFGASIAGGGTPIPTDKTVPSVPAGLNGTAASATQVNLTWSASTDNAGGSGVGGYKVYKNGLLAATATGTSTSVTGLAALTTYNFTVASFDNAGNNSAQSAIKAIKTLAGGGVVDTTPPSVPANLVGTALSSSQIKLTWSASTDNVGVTGYKVYKNGVLVTSVTGTSYTYLGLTANTSYNLTVASFDAAGKNSAQSAIKAVKTLAGTTPVGLPDVIVTNITYAAGKFTATIKNQGTAATPAGVSVVTRYRVDGTNVSLGTIPSLAAGASANVVGQPSFVMSKGSHTVDIKVDNADSFPESNENNNILVKTIVVP